MLEYKQALRKVMKLAKARRAIPLPLEECLGCVLARERKSLVALPPFDNAAVDGYALGSLGSHTYCVRAEIRAGDSFKGTLTKGKAAQIFTGAPVPRGTKAVVMQEYTERVNGSVKVLKNSEKSENIRRSGEDVMRGTSLLKAGTILNPPQLALLAASGYKSAAVFSPPKVSILVTGSEITRPGGKLKSGKIFDSNSILLRSLVTQSGGVPVNVASVRDHASKIRSSIVTGLESDLMLISGGVSVGKYDRVKDILEQEGVQRIFWKVNIKPGKPLYFGKRGRCLVFGLPGNPVSVFVTFFLFVRPVLRKMLGMREVREEITGRMTTNYQNGIRRHFVRVRCEAHGKGYQVTPLKQQGSHMMVSLASANSLLEVAPRALLKRYQNVTVQRIS